MSSLLFTFLSDGSSDRALLPVLDWLLRQHSTRPFQAQWADLRGLRQPPRTLAARIQTAVELYPCDLLFVHRDAEGEARETRVAEIRECLRDLSIPPAVCVIPVRMQEAWLLIDEPALRLAADNPNGRAPLPMPLLDQLEEILDPKEMICELLRTASELGPRRLRRWNPLPRIHRLADLIDDFGPLRRLAAFRALESDLQTILTQRAWQ